MIPVREDKNGILFWITVKPRSKKSGIIIGEEGTITVQVTAPPVEGKANEACRELLSRRLAVSKSSISIRTGEAAARKQIYCRNISADEARVRLSGEKYVHR